MCLSLGCDQKDKPEPKKVDQPSSMGFYETCEGCYKDYYMPSYNKCMMCSYKKRMPEPSFAGSSLLYKRKCIKCNVLQVELGENYCTECKSKRIH